jgi:hypothetical protein
MRIADDVRWWITREERRLVFSDRKEASTVR